MRKKAIIIGLILMAFVYGITYAYETSNYDQTAYNRSRLGDATGETNEGPLSAFLISLIVNNNNRWYCRGGSYANNGYLFVSFDTLAFGTTNTTRAALVSLQ